MNDNEKITANQSDKIEMMQKYIQDLEAVEKKLRIENNRLRDELNLISKEKFRLEKIIEEIGDPISIQDREYRIIYQNKAHRQLAGDQIGKYCYKAYADKDSICENCPVELTFKDGEIHTVEKIGNPRKGPLTVEITASPLTDSDGNIVAGIEVVRDTTEKKKIENSLRIAEAKFRSLVEQSLVGIYIYQDGYFVYVNPKAAEIFGYTQDEVMSRIPVESLVCEEDHNLVSENIRKRIEGEVKTIRYTLRGRKKDGNIIEIEVEGSATEYNGRPAIIGTLIDISSRKRLEDELYKAQKLESLGIFAGGIAHEFNNILTAIAGNISLAKMYAKPGYEVYDILSEAEKASSRAKDLTHQLLTFAKGGFPSKKLVHIQETIKSLSNFLLSGSNVKFDLSFQDDLWPVEVDERQISQVISNLISNAMEAMPNGGTLKISAENIIIDSEYLRFLRPGKYLKISFTDEGVGIPESERQKIFDPFYSTKQGGSGLGLTTAYSIVKKHEGNMTVESIEGVGTTFRVYLPAAPGEYREVKHTTHLAHTGKGRILVMDDEELVRVVINRLLNQCGYEADLTKDGSEMIEAYKKAKESGQPYDAVIMDLIVQEGMGGIDAVKILLEIDPEAKAIVSSGYSNDPVMANYKEYGFKDILAKPYRLEELSQVLHRITSGMNK